MEDFLFRVHPLTVVAGLAAFVVLATSLRRRPPGPVVVFVWVLAPVVLNPAFWYFGAPLMGWRMGGLGGLFYLWLVLPLNGLVTGAAAVPVLAYVLAGRPPGFRRIFEGVAIEAGALLLWFAIASRLHAYVGQLTA